MEYNTRRYNNWLHTSYGNNRRKNTVIRRNDKAIATETLSLPPPKPKIPEPKPRLIHMVTCKTVGEYKRNQEKICKFCLEEAKKAKKAQLPSQSNSSGKGHSKRTIQPSEPQQKPTKQSSKVKTKWTKEKLVKLATRNQCRQQCKPKAQSRTQSTMLKKKIQSVSTQTIIQLQSTTSCTAGIRQRSVN